MKRANGTGSIVKKQGRAKPYIVYAPAIYENGKKKSPYLGSFKLKSEAQAFLEDYNRNPTIAFKDMTFAEVYEDFKKSARYQKISKSMKDCYTAAYSHASALHGLPFSQVRTSQMQSVIDQMHSNGFSISAIQKERSLLSVLSNHALQNDIIEKSYSGFIVMPEVETKQKRGLTDLELEKIRRAAAAGDKTASWVLYLCYSGWRISEMLELTRFSFDEKELTLCGGKKTKYSKNRIVPIHPAVLPIVRSQLSQNGETIFCMDSGEPMKSDYFRRFLFSKMLKNLGLSSDLTPHCTRHTFATLLKRGGADEFYRKRLLGHSSGDVTNDVYTHADTQNLRTAIMCIDKALNNSKKPPDSSSVLSVTCP